MRSDLIVMIFDRQVDSQRVYDAIQSMRHSPLLGLDSAIIATRDSAGETNLYQRRKVPGATRSGVADALGLIADQLFCPDSEERRATLGKMGLDAGFVERILQAMDRDRPALLVLLGYDDIADRDELVRTLALFRGQIHQSTISSDAVETLQSLEHRPRQ